MNKGKTSANKRSKRKIHPVLKTLQFIYTVYVAFIFWIVYILLFPGFFIFLQKRSWHTRTYWLNRIWSRSFYVITMIPKFVEWHYKPDKKQRVIYCANHTSFLDISIMMSEMPSSTSFVGKSSLTKVPLFGYMFKRLHIAVDRNNVRSKYQTLEKAKLALEEGKDVVIYPEGGIISLVPPKMAAFKDGAFRLAVDMQVPIVPVTIIGNWETLPSDTMLFEFKGTGIVFHKPIETKGLTIENVSALRKQTYDIIQARLVEHYGIEKMGAVGSIETIDEVE